MLQYLSRPTTATGKQLPSYDITNKAPRQLYEPGWILYLKQKSSFHLTKDHTTQEREHVKKGRICGSKNWLCEFPHLNAALKYPPSPKKGPKWAAQLGISINTLDTKKIILLIMQPTLFLSHEITIYTISISESPLFQYAIFLPANKNG